MKVVSERDALGPELIQALLAAQGPDGGFGYLAGQASATEPTALAYLALGSLAGEATASAHGGARHWLLARQLPSGGWSARSGDPEESWTGALALLALADDPSSLDARRKGLRWLLKSSGRQVKVDPQVFALDGTLRGWPWVPGNFSWVEPTAYALLALKRLRREAEGAAQERIAEGESLLFDRVLDEGGWNYGNRRVYGQAYEPYAETTAVALLALQDKLGRPEVQRSLASLRSALGRNAASGLQVGWALLCFAVFGLPTHGMQQRLSALYRRDGFLGRVPTLAVAHLALSGAPGLKPFRVGGPQ